MRSLHVLKTSTGAVWALKQMRELKTLGVDVHVVLPPGGPLIQEYYRHGIRVHEASWELPLRTPVDWPRRAREIRSTVARIAPDIIHSHFVSTTLALRLALGKNHDTPRVFQIPGPLHLEHQLTAAVELASAGDADWWLGSCRWTNEAYRKRGVAEQRLGLAYYGTDVEEYARRSGEGKLREELGIGPSTFLVGMVAYLYAPKRYLGQNRGLKGHEDLIDAIGILRTQGEDVAAVMVGGAWGGADRYEAKVRKYAARHGGGRVFMLGMRRDVPELYPQFDVAVHPSHSENVGGAVESLLMGIPTISTDVGGFPDLIKHNETGWLVPPKDPASLAKAILYVLRNPMHAAAAAERGHALARELFDVRGNASDVLAFYDHIQRARARLEPAV